jgi:hypothetical protein
MMYLCYPTNIPESAKADLQTRSMPSDTVDSVARNLLVRATSPMTTERRRFAVENGEDTTKLLSLGGGLYPVGGR